MRAKRSHSTKARNRNKRRKSNLWWVITKINENNINNNNTISRNEFDDRPYVNFNILNNQFVALLDAGSNETLCNKHEYKTLQDLGFKTLRCKTFKIEPAFIYLKS